MGNTPTKEEVERGERVAMLASRIPLLFAFCAELIPYKDLVREVAGVCADRKSFAMAAAPLLEACGMDYEEHAENNRIKRDRADAIYNLLDVLERTEAEHAEMKDKDEKEAVGRATFLKILGGM